jgi:hypothetical protein
VTKPARFSQTDITRAIKGVEAAGLRVSSVDIQGDRIVVLVAGQDVAARKNPLDRIYAA